MNSDEQRKVKGSKVGVKAGMRSEYRREYLCDQWNGLVLAHE